MIGNTSMNAGSLVTSYNPWRALTRLTLALAIAGLLVGCGSDDSPADEDTADGADSSAPLVGDPDDGQAVFNQTCASLPSCHQAGTTQLATLEESVPTLTPEEIETIITEGTGTERDDMPPVAGISEQEIADVIAYLKQTYP